jgi:hypothetical protein
MKRASYFSAIRYQAQNATRKRLKGRRRQETGHELHQARKYILGLKEQIDEEKLSLPDSDSEPEQE